MTKLLTRPGGPNAGWRNWLQLLTEDAYSALVLRLGLGSVFVIGGWSKLSQLVDPARADAIVALYTGPKGYINTFFLEYLFSEGSWLSPWAFLTTLSTFELMSGLALVAGFLVRPLALLYGFLLWTFVFSLPVVLTPGVAVSETTYLAPALLVQVRDITLSGLMFVLFNLGSGSRSVDERIFGPNAAKATTNWEHLGLLVRLSLAATLLVGGFFAGMANIKTFGIPGIVLIAAGLAMLLDGRAAKVAGVALVLMMLVYMFGKVSLGKSVIANLNAIKREFALLAAGGLLAVRGGGDLYTGRALWGRAVEAVGDGRRHLAARPIKVSARGFMAYLVPVALLLFVMTAPGAKAQGFDLSGNRLAKQTVAIKANEAPGTIIVSFADRKLYKMVGTERAIAYPIGIPKDIARWDGTLHVTQKRKNPSWRPTSSMLKRNPRLPTYVPGGHRYNPMGVRALYLGHTFYRIHGTDAPWTIGKAASSGCVRMYNEDVIDLYNRTKIGAKVVVTWKSYQTEAVYASL